MKKSILALTLAAMISGGTVFAAEGVRFCKV